MFNLPYRPVKIRYHITVIRKRGSEASADAVDGMAIVAVIIMEKIFPL
jgi:hypothetical protein